MVKDISNIIQEHKKDIRRRTLTIQELAEVLGTSENKARQIPHSKGFPILILGKSRLTIVSKLDEWLEDNIGQLF